MIVQEGIAVGRSFAMFKNYHIDGNKEMIAIGTMNIFGSFTSCYLTTGKNVPLLKVSLKCLQCVSINISNLFSNKFSNISFCVGSIQTLHPEEKPQTNQTIFCILLTTWYKTNVVSGPFSRSAVNYNAGCKTATSNIVMAIAVMLTLLFLTPLFHFTPLVVLSAIIVSAMLGLIDYQAAIHLWKIDKFDFLVCFTAYVGVVLAVLKLA